MYQDEFDVTALPAELCVLRIMCGVEKISHFQDVKNAIITRNPPTERSLIANIIKLMKLALVAGATSATPERTFSLARRLKTWLRSTMTQKRFNSLSILSFHKDLTDKLSLVDVANEFVESKPARKNIFGKFVKDDL